MPGAKDPIKQKENWKCLRDSSVLEGKNNIGTSKKLQTQHSGSADLLEKLEKTNILGISRLKFNQSAKQNQLFVSLMTAEFEFGSFISWPFRTDQCGCEVFKGGIQDQKGFWLKINCKYSRMKVSS